VSDGKIETRRMKMTKYNVIANGTEMGIYESVEECIRDAGYSSIEDAAAACNQSVEEFLSAVKLIEIPKRTKMAKYSAEWKTAQTEKNGGWPQFHSNLKIWKWHKIAHDTEYSDGRYLSKDDCIEENKKS